MRNNVNLRLIVFAVLLWCSAAVCGKETGMPLYRRADAPVNERVKDLLSRMTLEEKVGQLCCPMGWESYELDGADIKLTDYFLDRMSPVPAGSMWAVLRADPWTGRTLENGVGPEDAARLLNMMQRYAVEETRLGIPLLFAEECAHGVMAVGTTVFPTGLLQASAWNTELLGRMGQAVASEARSLGANIGYGPVIDLAVDPRWSRMEEGFGEDPFLAGECGKAVAEGMYEGGLVPVLKHFAAYGMPSGGHNGAEASVGRSGLLNFFLPPFREVLSAVPAAVMTSYNPIDGVPSTCNAWLLGDVLRENWKFGGVVFSDLFSIDGLVGAGVASDRTDAAVKAISAGTDIDLGASSYPFLTEAVRKGMLSEDVIDSAVSRVLELKFSLGLFENPYVPENTGNTVCGSDEHRSIALEIVRQGTVLLKNDGILPLDRNTGRIAVIGPNAGTPYNMLGDYTAPQADGKVSTLAAALASGLPEGQVRYVRGCAVRDTSVTDLDAVREAVGWADVAIVAVGGSSARNSGTEYAETGAAEGGDAFSDMDCGEGYDRATLDLLGDQQELLECVASSGKPFVVVYIQGRPLDMDFAARHADALLVAWYPGEMGGEGIADVLFGACDASGRLPVSIPRDAGQIPVTYLHDGRDYMDMPGSPLYPFGYGLSYTSFEYSGIRTDASRMSVSCTVKNTGDRRGTEVVQLYIGDPVASVSRPGKMLRGFRRVELDPGESAEVEFVLGREDLGYYGSTTDFLEDGGTYNLMIGSSSGDIRLSAEIRTVAPGGYVWPEELPVAGTLERWRDLKFGVLIHWGLYSIPGIVESWSICPEDVDWIRRRQDLNYEDYKKWYWGLSEEFAAESFDPSGWADVFRDAGMKYMVFTTKHHDGFCLYDSGQTDFSVMNSPFGRDAFREVVEAFREKGFMLGAYFSKPDWHCPYYWWDRFATPDRNVNYKIERHPERWRMFCDYTSAQLREIAGNYGPLDILWLDGGWVAPPGQDIGMDSIVAGVRSIQPGILVVDRTVGGPHENYQTPERSVPDRQILHPWESCIPLTNDWGWVPDAEYKSPETVIALLTEVVAKGGSLLLGVGPTASGEIEEKAVSCLEKVGDWLAVNGEAIYATSPAEVYNDGNVFFTMNADGQTCYAIYVLRDGDKLPETIEWTGNVPEGRMVLLQNGKKVGYTVDSSGNVSVCVPEKLRSESLAFMFRLKK